jgi:hypothetical protein
MPLICLFLIVAYFYVDRRGLPQLPSLPEISAQDMQWVVGIILLCVALRLLGRVYAAFDRWMEDCHKRQLARYEIRRAAKQARREARRAARLAS